MMMMKKAAAVALAPVSSSTSELRRTRRTSATALVIIAALFIVAGAISTASAIPTCIVNCAQCVKIYGDFFDGHSCAESCLRSLFDAHVDCADPLTISKFLKYKR